MGRVNDRDGMVPILPFVLTPRPIQTLFPKSTDQFAGFVRIFDLEAGGVVGTLLVIIPNFTMLTGGLCLGIYVCLNLRIVCVYSHIVCDTYVCIHVDI